jgi:hypothetical protein
MARQNINIGSSANDGTGDPLRTAFDKINDNFVELYGTDDDSKTLASNLDVNGHNIISTRSNEDIKILPAGTGGVIASAVRIAGTTISSDDSSQITIAEHMQTTGTLNVAGATTLATSLTLATGATVTGIDNGALGSSATLLATQGAIKTYVDSQVTAQDLDLAGDSGTGAVDLDSQSLTIAGGTGLTSVAGSQTVTLNIDSTVATLTGSQTLTNKVLTAPTINAATMTGTVTVDSISMADNTITTGASNANLELDASGTGSVRLIAPTTAVATLTTADIATTGTHTVTGQSDIDAVRIKDNGITTNASNANLELSANGSGVVDVKDAMTTVGQTITGNVVIDGQFDIDNISISGNGIIATNSGGGININPNATGQVTIGGTVVQIPGLMSATDINVTSNVLLGSDCLITTEVSNADINIEANGTGSVYVDELRFRNNNITTHVTNANLELNTDGTGTIELQTNTNVTGTITASTALSAPTLTRTGNMSIDVSGYVVIDADAGDIYLKDDGTNFAILSNSAGNLEIKSGNTTALSMTGANVAAQGNLSVAGAFIGGRQTISGAGAINLTTLFTEITTTGAQAFTLANGTVGQVKIITMAVDGGDATITPTTFANGTSMTMDAVHDSVTLIYGASGWVVLASQNVTVNA